MNSEPQSNLKAIGDKTSVSHDILIVDDEMSNLKLLAEYLVRAGYQVRPTESPLLAIDSALVKPPALILLDVRMPELDGFEVCKRLKQDERTRDVPVIFTSALQDVRSRVRGFEAGGVDFISRPLQESEVVARVRTHMDLRNMQLDLERMVGERTAEVIDSEQRFRSTFEQAAVGIAHFSAVDPVGSFLRINKKFCDIVGYTKEEMLELTFQDITHPDDLDAALDYVQQVLANEIETYSMDKRYYRKDGTIVWVTLTVSLVFDKGGHPKYFVSVVQDISDRKQAEESLQKSESNIRLLLDSTAEGIYGLDVNGNGTFANPACIRLLGYETADDLIGKNMHHLIHHSYSDGTPYPIEKCFIYQAYLKGENVHVSDEVLWRADGTSFPVEYWSYPIIRDNQILGAVIAFFDITDRKQAEEDLRQSHDFLKHLTDAVPDAIYSIKMPERTINWANDSFNVLGYEPEEYIGQSTKSFYANPDDYEVVGRLQQDAVRKGEDIIRTEISALRKDGRVIPAELTATYYKQDGKISRITALVRDITERKLFEENLAKSEAKYRGLVDNSIVGVFNSTFDGQFLFVNDAMARMFDFENAASMIAGGVLDRWRNPEERDRMLTTLREQGSVTNFEAELITQSRRQIHVLFSAKQIGDDIIGMMMDITDRKKAEEKVLDYQQRLKTMASRLTIAEEKDRRIIAANLHDYVGQSLALARIQLSSTIRLTSDSKLAEKLGYISDVLLKSIKDTKQVMFDLSPPTMHKMGLVSAISEWLEVQIEGKHGLKAEFVNNIPDNRRKAVDPDVSTILFRNVRELVINVIKHARANKVRVRLEDRSSSIRIIVEDDGIGFDPRAVTQTEGRKGSFGLFSVEELMSDLGGSLRIVSEPGKGCTAILSAPLIVNHSRGRD